MTSPSKPSDTDGSQVAAKQEFEASKVAPSTDGSDVAAHQEFDASKTTPSTDGSDVAAQQEFDASKAAPSTDGSNEAAEHEIEASEVALSTDGSDIAAKQEFEASTTVIEQVRKFLDDPKVKDAPMNTKRAFLSSKGLSPDIIQQVLELSPPSTALSVAEFANQRPLPPARQPQLRREDVPPVVTYPEFLVQPQKPPPLVTMSRLINTAYLAGGAAAVIYGLSKYIVGPMSESLTMARHEFAEHTSSHLDTFNEKLTTLVSTVPSKSHASTKSEIADDIDNESEASDPTELYHRDFGTQTSPLPSSSELNIPPTDPELRIVPTPLEAQSKRLSILQSHVSEILQGSLENGVTNEAMQESVSDLRNYLDTLVYSPSAYQYHSGDTVYTPPGTPGATKKTDDAVHALKAEIRGVKGVLLSAKRFPSARVGA